MISTLQNQKFNVGHEDFGWREGKDRKMRELGLKDGGRLRTY